MSAEKVMVFKGPVDVDSDSDDGSVCSLRSAMNESDAGGTRVFEKDRVHEDAWKATQDCPQADDNGGLCFFCGKQTRSQQELDTHRTACRGCRGCCQKRPVAWRSDNLGFPEMSPD